MNGIKLPLSLSELIKRQASVQTGTVAPCNSTEKTTLAHSRGKVYQKTHPQSTVRHK